jgi:ABC-type sugar transport system ATPase subunit
MDEPLSNLDAKLRAQTRLELVELWHRLQTTIVYVTHDQVEAMTMASRIAVIADGKLQQVGTPSDVYHQPANLMVARFIGSPQMNTFSATLSAGPDGAELRVGGQLVAVVSLPEAARDDVVDGRRVTVGVRADHLQIAEHGTLTGTVRAVEQLGYESHVICDVDGNLVTVRQPESVPVPIVGCPVRLTLDPTRLHLFDPDSGLRL